MGAFCGVAIMLLLWFESSPKITRLAHRRKSLTEIHWKSDTTNQRKPTRAAFLWPSLFRSQGFDRVHRGRTARRQVAGQPCSPDKSERNHAVSDRINRVHIEQ